MKGTIKMDDKEFYLQLMAINSKLDTLLAKAVTKDDCQAKRHECKKENLEPIRAFQYKLIGAILMINIVIAIVIKKF